MEPHLRFLLLGPFEAWRDEERLPVQVWRTRKHAALLKILVGQRRRAVPTDQLIEWLWPDLSPEAGLANLYVGISLIRRVLEPAKTPAASSYVLTHHPGYLFEPSPDCWIDVDEFRAHISAAQAHLRRGDAALALHACEAAAALYRGDYLEDDPYEDWAIGPREQIREEYLELLSQLYRLYLAAGDVAAALFRAQQALALDPCREQAHRQVMRAYYLLGRRADALRQFRRCRQILQAELEVEPMPRTLLLYQQILSDRVEIAVEAAMSQPDLGRLPFVGRQSELAAMQRTLDRIQREGCQVLLVNGETGVGKTRLIEEFIAAIRPQSITFLRASCHALDRDIPYQPLREALSIALATTDATAMVKTLGPSAAVLAGLLPMLWEKCPDLKPPPALAPSDELARLLHGLARLIQNLARAGPLLLVIDDLHWTDSATLHALHYLTEHLNRSPILLLAACRTEAMEAAAGSDTTPLARFLADLRRGNRLTELALPRLSQPEVTALIAALARSPHGGTLFSRRLYQETAGNPLFLVETLRTLLEQGVLYRDETGAWATDLDEVTQAYEELPIPATIREAVLSRSRQLSEPQQRALAAMATIGRPATFELWRRVTGDSEETLLDTLECCLARQLLVRQVDGRYDFDHGLVRDILVHELCPERRRLLHRRVAEVLVERNQEVLAGEIAHHYCEAEMWLPALDYLEQAGHAAMRLFAYQEAWPYFTRAHDLLERLAVKSAERRYSVARQLHRIASMIGRREEAGQYLQEALALARALDDPVKLAETLHMLCRYHFFGGDVELAGQLCQEAIDLSRQAGDTRLEANVLRQQSLICRRSGRHEEAWTALERALDLSRQIGDPQLEVLNLNVAGTVHYKQGDYARALTVWQAALQAEVAGNLGEAYQALGRHSESLSLRQEGLEVARAIGYRIPQPDCLLGLGATHSDLGQHDEAIALIEQALSLAREVGQRHLVANVLNGLARARLRRGAEDDPRQALALAEEALNLSRGIDLRHGGMAALSLKGRALLVMGQAEAAGEASQAAVDLLEGQRAGEGDEASIYYYHAQILSAQGRATEAKAFLSRARAEMEAQAARIADAGLRQSFLDNVPSNRSIRRAWQEVQPGS
ncbi:MAG: AAA family ATPase [Anaerolineae bacterium]|nr:AAA family ATPase [Anaerolineae bacterium]